MVFALKIDEIFGGVMIDVDEIVFADVLDNAIFADEIRSVWVTSLIVSTLKNEDEIIFCSYLNQWIYRENDDEFDTFKSLNMKILESNFGRWRINTIIKNLLKSGIIEVNDSYLVGEFSKGYRLTDRFRESKQVKYSVKTPKMIKLLEKRFWDKLSDVSGNVIATLLMRSYPNVELPSDAEILKEAKRLISIGYETNKGKKLIFANKLSRNNPRFVGKKLAFVEEDIKLWKRLTSFGLMIPIVSENAGGRVYDSFNLAPSWIRNLLKIDGEQLIEFDFKCSSPSIALSIDEMGGTLSFITHQQVADFIETDLKVVKTEHLKYFNCSVLTQISLEVDAFYKHFDPQFRTNLITLKKSIGNDKVAKMMFRKEVDIMTQIVKKLNQSFIYVFDAILVKCSKGIEDMINTTLIDNNVRTTC